MQHAITQSERFDFDIPIDEIERVEFRYVQGDTIRDVEWPGDHTNEVGSHAIEVVWTPDDSSRFDVGEVVCQTRITLKASPYQPETDIIALRMDRSLFEVAHG